MIPAAAHVDDTIACPFRRPIAAFPDHNPHASDPCGWSGSWADYLAHALTHPLPHPDDREAWVPARRTFVGASEVAAVCGFNPYDSALDVWAAKVRGTTKRKPNLEGRKTAVLGHLMEPKLLEWYGLEHDVTLTSPATRRHPSYPWAAATPDGDSSTGELVQVKMVGANMLHHWIDGPPRYTVVQVQWELFVWERERAVVLAGLGGTDIEQFPIERDDGLIESLRALVEVFWRDTVVTRQIPQDFDGVASDETLRMIFPQVFRGMARATPEIIELAEGYVAAHAQAKAHDDVKEELGQRLKAAIGDREGFEWGRANKVTYKNSKGSLDKLGLAQALLEQFVPVEANRQSWIDTFTSEIGTRRLNVSVKK